MTNKALALIYPPDLIANAIETEINRKGKAKRDCRIIDNPNTGKAARKREIMRKYNCATWKAARKAQKRVRHSL